MPIYANMKTLPFAGGFFAVMTVIFCGQSPQQVNLNVGGVKSGGVAELYSSYLFCCGGSHVAYLRMLR